LRRALIAFAVAAAGFAAWTWVAAPPRLPLDRLRMQAPGAAGGPPPFAEFEVPAPEGRRAKARFFHLDRLPPGDEATLCAGLRANLLRARNGAGPSDDQPEEAVKEAKASIDKICQGEAPRLRGAAFARALGEPLFALRMIEDADHMTPAMQAAIARLIVARLREAAEAGETDAATGLGTYVLGSDSDRSGLALKRFSTDLDRLATELCGAEHAVECRGIRLARVGQSYARLGRLSNEEQHFRDMAEALAAAEPNIRRITIKELRLSMLEDVVSAYGYGGEAGRDPELLRRAVRIAESIAAELKPAEGEDGSHAYGEALTTLATALGRYAAHAPDRIGATRRAIETGEAAITLREKHLPDHPSWTSRINLASEQRDLFELTLQAEWIDKAEANARRALAIKTGALGDDAPDANLFYARMRLGQILAWKAKHGANLADAQRGDLAAESKKLLDEAEEVFRGLNSQAYLRIIARTRPLLPNEDEPKR
jgi:hypothetical protein